MATFAEWDETLPTWRDYARWRLNDLNAAAPFAWDETYLAMYTSFGPVEGLARVAAHIATKISQRVTAFGEAAGIRFTRGNADYYEELAEIIRAEPPFIPGVPFTPRKAIRVGKLTAGVADLCEIPDTVCVNPCPEPLVT